MNYHFIYRITPNNEERLGGYFTAEEAERLRKSMSEEAERLKMSDTTYLVRYEAK